MLSIKEVATIIDGTIVGRQNGRIKYLLTDSRNLTTTEDVLFFAIDGQFHNGHEFIPTLLEQGINGFVVSETPAAEWTTKASFLLVTDVIEALQKLAGWWRRQFNIPIIGITGSNGKTIVKEWIAQCIEDTKRLTRNPGSYNSQIGVPLSLWMLNSDAELGIFEAGISQPGEMQILQQIMQPTIGIFTNIGDAHQEHFPNLKSKLIEKLKLFNTAETIIYRKRNNWTDEIIEQTFPEHRLFSWSFSKNAQVEACLCSNNHLEVTHKGNELNFKLPFTDKASVENLMHTITTLFYLGYTTHYIKKALKLLRAVPMRLEQKAGKNQTTIINDSYNSDLGSLANGLDFLSQQNQHAQKVVVLSDILQSGFSKANLYREVAMLINNHQPDLFLGIGTDIKQFESLFSIEKQFFGTTGEAIDFLEQTPVSDTTILLKGSRQYHFEKIDRLLELKSHRTILEVNLNSLAANLNYFKSLLNDETGIIVMVKAFSYGSGSHEIANILQFNHVAYLAVAFADEGSELRGKGIETPIMVMNPDVSDFENIMDHKLEPVIFEHHILNKFSKYADNRGQRNFPVHIKLNTGMNRSGFNSSQLASVCKDLNRHPAIKVKSAFSHLAASDESKHDAFTHQQARSFLQMANTIELQLGYSIKRHILNSAGIERFPEYQFDYVRLGIGLYGVSQLNEDIKQVSRLKTRIAQIREVKENETVGYGRKGTVTKPTRIATIPIGYADGFRRALGNGTGKVWINGKLCPVVGNICMDMSMIDITNTHAKVNDDVIIFGPELPITQVAEWLNTIPYEVLTSVSARVKRIYTKE
ncbi:MAG: bifunctional UDP-N-acetylmuramoyl-tripeptide:D-alanyl-D-alanine ligase/alanine racemase [Salinivirgaceae bacterium]|jgi:alanine racemase|nr:bifunctional UDP-N-acetylmuramoyl-tripeptide:D-alanyl-D-alanine ligase/alanine racemase [Salinivirgaceae bacterium]